MSKIFRCAVLTVLVLSMIVIFCFSEDTKTYTNEDIGFSIDYPALWNPTKVTGGNIVVLFTAGAINRNLQVMHDQGGEEGGMAALERLAGILQNQNVFTAEWREVNGRRSYFQVVEWSSLLGNNRAIRLMVPDGDHYFLIMGVCPASEFADLNPLLESCVLSFRIIG